MAADIVGPTVFFTSLVLLILVPVYLRNRLQQKQLEAIATAIEKGIDPERIRSSLPVPDRAADANGNWKASLLLMGLGVVYILLIALPVVLERGASSPDETVPVFLPGAIMLVIGAILMYIHKTVVGRVIGYGEAKPGAANASNGAGDDSLL